MKLYKEAKVVHPHATGSGKTSESVRFMLLLQCRTLRVSADSSHFTEQ